MECQRAKGDPSGTRGRVHKRATMNVLIRRIHDIYLDWLQQAQPSPTMTKMEMLTNLAGFVFPKSMPAHHHTTTTTVDDAASSPPSI
jgi:hypothetical protein